ncbi:hypothetical protein FB567DRAFT_532434 [Paraphoma chrysanthemicola]|uniref:Uncharacterized protein n=1 Tax=Paraphoma chrysanthemicola TaxID=798071 RepID=A0A8K0VVR2_9PLEO|nr:hypothetical protein FB567DRAFT_532434 [Paraphoma chrysanthemicola]
MSRLPEAASHTMASVLELLPSARVFAGPGDNLFGCNRIWVVLYAGATQIDYPTATERRNNHRFVIGRNGNDSNDLVLLSHILSGSSKEDAHNELYNALSDFGDFSTDWNHGSGELPHPALREDCPLVWTVDFNEDRAFYDRDGQHLVYQFSMPERHALRHKDFQSYSPMQLPILHLTEAQAACSTDSAPRDVIPQTLFDLVYRFATDYERNWQTSSLTDDRYGLHPLALGILSCFTLNITTQKVAAANLHMYKYRVRADHNNLLKWRTWPSNIVTTVSLGSTQVIVTKRMDLATSLVHEHFSELVWDDYFPRYKHDFYDRVPDNFPPLNRRHTYVEVQYVVTSIRQIQCFKLIWDFGRRRLECTPLIDFFGGDGPPSETGVRWLLNAIHRETYPIHNPIHGLPPEIQEMILEYSCPSLSHNMFDRAIFAAKLGIGVPFSFHEKTFPLRRCTLTKERKIDTNEPEYHIFIWNEYVGMTYQVDKGRRGKDRRINWIGDGIWHASRKFNRIS